MTNIMKLILTAVLCVLLTEVPAAEKADFIVPPEVVIHHTPERSFIGPGMILLVNGDLLMAAPWGRPPTNFEQLAAKFPVPMLYRSTDGGRTWQEQGRMKMEWSLPGMVSDGGVTFLRVKDGRLAALLPGMCRDKRAAVCRSSLFLKTTARRGLRRGSSARPRVRGM